MKLSPEDIQRLTTSEEEFKTRNATRKAYLLKVGAVFAAKNLDDGYMSHFVVSKTGAKPILIDKDLLKTLPDTQTPTFDGDFANLLKEAPKVVIDDLQTGDVYKAPEKVIVVSKEASKTKDYVKAMLEQNAAKKRDEMAKLAQDEAEAVNSLKTEFKSHADQKKAHFSKLGKAFSRHFLQLKAPNTPATIGDLPDEDGLPFAQSEHVRQQKRSSFVGDYTSQALRKTPTGTRKSDLSRQAAGAEAFHEDKDIAEEEVVAMVQKAQSVLPAPRSTAAVVKTPLQLKAENAALVKASLEKLVAKKQEKQVQLASARPEVQQKEQDSKLQAKQHQTQKKSHYAKFASSVINKPSYTSMMPAIHGRQKEAGVAVVPDEEVVAQAKQNARRASTFKGDFGSLIPAEETLSKDEALVPKSANYALKVLSQITSQKKAEKAAQAAADPVEFKRVEDEKAKLVARNADRKAHFSKLNAIFATHRPTNPSAVSSPRIDIESPRVDAAFAEGRKSDHTGDATRSLRRSPQVTNRALLSERDAAVNSFFEAMLQEEAEQAAQDAIHYQVYLDTLQKAKLVFPTVRKATEVVKPSLPGDFKSAAFAKSLLDTYSAQRKDEKQIFSKVDPVEFKKHEDAKVERKQRENAKKSHYAKMGNILSTKPPFVSMMKKMDGELKDKAAPLPDPEFIAKLRRGSVFKQDYGSLMRRTPKPVKDQSETRNGQFVEMLLEKHNAKKYAELEDLARNNPKELEYVMNLKDESKKREVEKKAHLMKLGKVFAPHKPVGASVMRAARVDVSSHSLDSELAEAIRLSFQGDVTNFLREAPKPTEKREDAEERIEYMRDYIRALMTGEDDEFRMAAMAKARQVRRILPAPRAVIEAVKPPPAVDHKNASFIKAMLEKHIAKKNDEQKELSNLSPEDRQQRLDEKGMTARRYKEKIEHFSKMGETFRPPPSGIVQVSALLLNQAREEANVASPPATADVFYRNSYGPIVDIDPNLSVETEATVRSPPKIKIALSKITPTDDEKKVETKIVAAPAPPAPSALTKFLGLLGLLSKPSAGKRAPRSIPSQARAAVTKVDAVDKYTKYRNLLRMNFTNQCVKERMNKDGLSKRDIDLFFNPLAGDSAPKSNTTGGMLLSPAFKVANAVSTAKELRSPIQVKSVAGANDKVRNEVFFLELLEVKTSFYYYILNYVI